VNQQIIITFHAYVSPDKKTGEVRDLPEFLKESNLSCFSFAHYGEPYPSTVIGYTVAVCTCHFYSKDMPELFAGNKNYSDLITGAALVP
jgi:hypothetical protein